MKPPSIRTVHRDDHTAVVQVIADFGLDCDMQTVADAYASAILPGWRWTHSRQRDVDLYRVLHATYTERGTKQ